jgi:ATP-dependent Clp protease ATP-binding subunit ClpA
MQGYNFSENVRKVLADARDLSSQQRTEYVSPDHLFAALARTANCGAAGVLTEMGIDAHAVGAEVEARMPPGKAERPTGPVLPYTTRAKKVLELAMASAYELHHSFVGTEHLLLGLIREEQSVAAQALVRSGATLERTQTVVGDRIMKRPVKPSDDFLVAATRVTLQPRSVTLSIEHHDGRVETVRVENMRDAVAKLFKLFGGA